LFYVNKVAKNLQNSIRYSPPSSCSFFPTGTERLHEIQEWLPFFLDFREGFGKVADAAGGIVEAFHTFCCGLEALVIDRQVELLQQMFHRFKAGDISKALFKGGAYFVQSEGLGVVLAEAGGIVGNGLITGQGLLQGFYFRGDFSLP
jgi:hypothetical protein